MNKKQFRTCLQVLAVLLVLVITLTAYAAGKYIKTISFGGSVTFTASLAENLILQEHEAIRQTDGTYSLNMEKAVTQNTYVLIPGLDIPKDPYIVIQDKTKIPAYLYIKIENNLDAPVTYSLEDCWKPLSSLDSNAPGDVYVYCTKDENGSWTPAVIKTDLEINIIKTKTVCVSQALLAGSDSETDVLEISALLKEKVGTNDAVQTYG